MTVPSPTGGEQQLRIYRLREGAMDEFLALWREHVVPARRAHGFVVVGAWVDRTAGEFAWVVGHPGPEGLEAAERAYEAGPEKAAFPRRPGELFERVELRTMRPFAP